MRLAETLSRVVAVAGAIEGQLELLPLLALARMAALLGDELARRGFSVDGNRARRAAGELTVEIALDHGRVTLRLAGEEEVTVAGEAEVAAPAASRPAAEADARARLGAELAAGADARAAAVHEAARARLDAAAAALRAELDDVVARVTATALRERAAQLGEIESVVEDPATGELTIKVRV